MDTKFLNGLVDQGFGLRITGNAVVITTAASSDTASGLEAQPTVRIKMPATLPIRFYPNQNKRTGPFAPKNPPRVKINNIQQKFDTIEEYRDFLYESYAEHLLKVQEFRKEKIDNRLELNSELKRQKEEAAKTWLPQKPPTPTVVLPDRDIEDLDETEDKEEDSK